MKKRMMIRTALLASLGLLVIAASGFAGAQQAPKAHSGEDFAKHRQTLLAVCEGKSEGEKVRFTDIRGNEQDGVCTKHGDKLMPFREDFVKRQQALLAVCEGKSEGEKVRFTDLRGNERDGVCRKRGDELIPFSDRPKRTGDKSRRKTYNKENFIKHHQTLLAVCEGKSEGEKVRFTDVRGNERDGVCKKRGEELMPFPEKFQGKEPLNETKK